MLNISRGMVPVLWKNLYALKAVVSTCLLMRRTIRHDARMCRWSSESSDRPRRDASSQSASTPSKSRVSMHRLMRVWISSFVATSAGEGSAGTLAATRASPGLPAPTEPAGRSALFLTTGVRGIFVTCGRELSVPVPVPVVAVTGLTEPLVEMPVSPLLRCITGSMAEHSRRSDERPRP